MHNSRDEVAESQHPVLPHVPEDKQRHRPFRHYEADFPQRIAQPLGPEHAHLLSSVRFEHQLPVNQAAHQVFEVGEGYSTCAVFLCCV